MKTMPQLKTLMTPFPYSVDIDAPVDEARELMEAHQIHHLPVTDGHALVGLVTDRELRAGADTESTVENDALKVRSIYTAQTQIVDLNEPLDTVLLKMAKRRIDSVLVTRKGNLAGVFTSTDVCRSFGEYLRDTFRPDDGNDAA